MPRISPSRLLALAAVAALSAHLLHDLTGFGSPAFARGLADWFQPLVYLACGAVTFGRARTLRGQRAPWLLLGTGLILFGLGSVVYNLAFRTEAEPPFPSVADALWLSLYPLAFAAVALLAKRRLGSTGATVWLDGLIAGAVVAGVAAAVLFERLFDEAVGDGVASVARLGYPVGDMVLLGFVVAIWSVSGPRSQRFWVVLGLGFALLAIGDGWYVVQAARGEWAPGGLLDFPYTLATMALAASAWVLPPDRPADDVATRPVALPIVFACTAVGLAGYGVIEALNPIAVVLTLLTLVLVAARLALALLWLTGQRQELAALAATDPLTGLANHRTVHDRLKDELDRARRSGRPLSLVTVDIDHFKSLNDTYGHAEGDAALQAIARALRSRCRPSDLVGRVGGEEFAIVLPGLGPEEAFALAERCREAVTEVTSHGVPLSCSAGVASYPADDRRGDRLVELADGALYWAKRSGRARTRRFDPREVALLSRREQRGQVQGVLDDPAALTPVFQPVVELATGRVAGYEALMRFTGTEPVRPPDQWFAQARRCGLGPQLEARAIATSLAVGGRPPGTFLSINVSPGALLSPEVASVLPADLHDLVIELTEDEVFTGDAALDSALASLRERGARIAVDDAGAGYAGLQQLVRIKPEILKLDRSLIQGVHEDASKIALLEALSGFASTTGAAVCGEGVEHEAELRALARFDVTYAQGYALAHPGPAWPAIDAEVAREASLRARWGMRVGVEEAGAGGARSLGTVAETIAQVRGRAQIAGAVRAIERAMDADEAVVSRVRFGDRCVETMNETGWDMPDTRYAFDDYPTTERVLTHGTLGQIVAGDPAADPAELALLERYELGAVLMAPIVFRGETVGLLELYRRVARPWTSAEIDRARVLAHHLGAALQGDAGTAPPPPADPGDHPPGLVELRPAR